MSDSEKKSQEKDVAESAGNAKNEASATQPANVGIAAALAGAAVELGAVAASETAAEDLAAAAADAAAVSEPAPPDSPVAIPRRRKLNKGKTSSSSKSAEPETRRTRRRRPSATTSEDEGELKPRRRHHVKKDKDDSETEKKSSKNEPPEQEDEEKLAQWAKILSDAKIAKERSAWWKFWKWRLFKREPKTPEIKSLPPPPKPKVEYVESRRAFKDFSREAVLVFREMKLLTRPQIEEMKALRNQCIGELILIVFLCGVGAFMFRFTEATFEAMYKCGVKRVKRDFIEELWRSSQYMKEEEWKSRARRKLMEFEEQLSTAFEAGISSYSGHKTWSFVNSLLYSLTVFTTIGYGHIAPATNTGKALTIAYAIIGIPLFLILLADFGKLFTRWIKWLWAFVRRLYYTGSCKKVRKTAPVQEVMKGVQLVYDIAAFRRPSQLPDGVQIEDGTLPPTPAPSNYVIDDEFNLPISVAITVLLLYIFCGAIVFCFWEEWTFFESFYFVFISMSTIGFGDFVPQNKMYMMASIVYLAFGLALTSMCINVVQEMLSDTFRQASAKIGATIGLKMEASKEGTGGTVTPTHVELAQIHQSPSQL